MKHFRKYPVFALALFFGLAQAQTIDPDMLPPIDYSKIVNAPTPITNNNQLVNGAGYLTSEIDGSINNEIQSIGLVGNILSLSGDDSIVDLSPYLDNTDTNTNAATICQSGEFLGGGLDGCIVPSGGIDWGETQTSQILDSSGFSAFNFDTSNSISSSNLMSLSNLGVEKFHISSDGGIFIDGGSIRPYFGQVAIYGNSNIQLRPSNATNLSRIDLFSSNGYSGITTANTNGVMVESGGADSASFSAINLKSKNPVSLGDLLSIQNQNTEVLKIDSLGNIYPKSSQVGGGYFTSTNGGVVAVGTESVILGDHNGQNRNNSSLNKSELVFGSVDDAYIYPFEHNSGTGKSRLHLRGSRPSSADVNGDGAPISIGGGLGRGTGNNGPIIFDQMRVTTVQDVDLVAGETALYLDESSNKLIFKSKYSDGTTVKIFEINANP